jgi:signal peptidase I
MMWYRVLGLVALALAAFAFGLRRRAAVITVTGDSMWPTFVPEDRVLVRRTGLARLQVGQVVVAAQPGESGKWPLVQHGPVGRHQWVIKRIAAVPGDPRPEYCPAAAPDQPERLVPRDKLVLLGDNAAWSHDSRQIGYFPADRLLGVVVRRLTWPPASGDTGA